ncbi:hypothetical protein LH435_02530 [Laribacter hongkongensis]|uniref:hypothetical protein n=1 Tax=Laribacter hongkongensis TaxID=168471 RepID=UPI001EFC86C9|nr:hypothetical protein [Laribacter hongkongensis]MCG9010412.1 hypothetical protein [Laribacter hongkongensis]MCG9046465.1 hypothetical protein [Laribacter hongkongensis]MCG9072903.1 hypothetical protein [Laribacter hongkongensis]
MSVSLGGGLERDWQAGMTTGQYPSCPAEGGYRQEQTQTSAGCVPDAGPARRLS